MLREKIEKNNQEENKTIGIKRMKTKNESKKTNVIKLKGMKLQKYNQEKYKALK
jgi:hypothetical protein